MTIPKRSNKAPFIRSKLITDTKKKELYELSDKEFRIILLKKLNGVQDPTDS